MENKIKKLAVLIDADNASADIAEGLFKEIAKYGIASTKRIYGDWSGTRLKKWKEILLPFAITPIQQFAYTRGKDATDMMIIINAMDLLYSETFDGFCIVSSDSDFTPLASRIRENGLTVYGFGGKKTPESLRKACDKFIYTERLEQPREQNSQTDSSSTKPSSTQSSSAKPSNEKMNKIKMDTRLMNLIRDAIDENSDDSGWANLGGMGSYMNRVSSDFDVTNYGFSKLSDLIKSIDLFKTQLKGSHLQVCKK